MEKQQTVVNSAEYSGIALHSGARSRVRIHSAPENTGIVFRRVDLPGKPEVRALASNVVDVRRGTTIASGNAVVFTVEHIMSALHAFHVDNCIVEMDGMEPPIGDGSSLPYCRMVREAGIVQQEAEAKVFTPSKPLYVEGGHTRLVIVPGDVLRVVCTTSFPGCPIDPQFYEFTATDPEAYETEIAGGRTFVDFRDLQQLLAMRLVKGGSLDNAVVMHDGAIVSKEGMRHKEEFARHKMMDMVGDLYLTGMRVRARIASVKSGHPTHVKLAQEMLARYAAKQK